MVRTMHVFKGATMVHEITADSEIEAYAESKKLMKQYPPEIYGTIIRLPKKTKIGKDEFWYAEVEHYSCG